MSTNGIFILCLGISILIIFLLILIFAKGNGLFILAVAAVSLALILIAICLYLMNNLLSRLDDDGKSLGAEVNLLDIDLSKLKKAVNYLGQDNHGASQSIDAFVAAIIANNNEKELDTSNIRIYKPDLNQEILKEDKDSTEISNENENIIIDMTDITPTPKPVVDLNGTVPISNEILTESMKKLIVSIQKQSVVINEVTQAVTQVQEVAVANVIQTIQTNPTVQQNIFTSPTVQQSIINIAPIQEVINNGGVVDLTPINNNVALLNANAAANNIRFDAVKQAFNVVFDAIDIEKYHGSTPEYFKYNQTVQDLSDPSIVYASGNLSGYLENDSGMIPDTYQTITNNETFTFKTDEGTSYIHIDTNFEPSFDSTKLVYYNLITSDNTILITTEQFSLNSGFSSGIFSYKFPSGNYKLELHDSETHVKYLTFNFTLIYN
jgi:hypothetical protein